MKLLSRAVPAAVCALSLVAVGCGAAASGTPDPVKLTVTDRFGGETVLDRPGPEVRDGDSVLDVLKRNAQVQMGPGESIVAIEGRRAAPKNTRPIAWSLYINGIRAEKRATDTDVHGGDRIWLDRRDQSAAVRIPAVVGSYPEPFVNGYLGERRPTRMECDEAVEAACDAVAKRLGDLGVVVGRSRVGTEQGEESLRILVGRWSTLRGDRAVEQLEEGPQASGVYARVAADGRSITALDGRGHAARRLGAGTGLIAATRWRDQSPVWIVTGTDAAGVQTAAEQGLDETVLHEKFALAISGGLPVQLPVVSQRP